jgi:nitroreductase
MTAPRIADHPIDEYFLARWSPRAFDGSTLTEADLKPLFEAARWAPRPTTISPGALAGR